MKSTSQNGSSLVAVLAVIVVLVLLGFIGWYSFMRPQSSFVPSQGQNIYADWKSYSGTDFSFKYPSDWLELVNYTNGIVVKSADFASVNNLRAISGRSAVSVRSTKYDQVQNDGSTELDTLKELAIVQANGQVLTQDFIKVAGRDAVKITHKSGENGNSHTTIIFLKDSMQYVIDQQYKIDTTNPESSVLDGIGATFTFAS